MLQRLILLALVSMLVPPAPAQEAEPKEPQQQLETRIVRVEHIGAEQVAHLVFGTLRAVGNNTLGAVSITGTKEQLDQVEAQIRALDVPRAESAAPESRNVEIMVHYLGAGVGTQPIPADSRLNTVVEQLRENFPYESYSLLASYMVRSSVSPNDLVSAQGLLPTLGYEPMDEQGEPSLTSSYELGFQLVQVLGEAPNRTTLLRRLRAAWRFPVYHMGKPTYQDAEIQTGVDLPEGKLVVLGKAGLAGPDKGIFLVLEARPVD